MANLDEIRRVYEMVDENADGILSVEEISGFVNKIGLPISVEDLRCMIISTSTRTPLSTTQDDCSHLQFEEFVHLYQSIFDSEEKDELKDLMEAFRVFDLNEDGYISSAELQQVLSTMGLIPQSHDPQHCLRMICRFDSDCNGMLDFSEFKTMMCSTLSP